MKPIQLCQKSKLGCDFCTSQRFCRFMSMNNDELKSLDDKEKQKVGNKRQYRIKLAYKYYSDFLCDLVNSTTDNYPVYKDIKRQIENVTKSVNGIVQLHLFSIKLIDLRDVVITVIGGEGYCILSGIGIIECEFDDENKIPTFCVIGKMWEYFIYYLDGEDSYAELIQCDIDLI